MKDLLKAILMKLGLFNFFKKLSNKAAGSSAKSKNQTVLEEELKYSSTNLDPSAFDSLAFSIRMQIHLIEKTLVKGDADRINLLQLVKLTEKTQRVLDLFPDYDRNSDLVVETLGIIETATNYISDKKGTEKLLKDFVRKNKLENVTPRVIYIKNVGADYVQPCEAAEKFMSNRHSVRAFENRTVEPSVVREIVELAEKCPSACNRQPWKVYYTESPEKISKFKPNPAVTKDINNFLIVTVNKNMFSSAEILQAWINGGIFLESLVMAIHAKGMGSCLFQEIKGTAQYNNVKTVAGIPDNEDIVALVGFGYLREEYPIIETHRKSAEEILTEF